MNADRTTTRPEFRRPRATLSGFTVTELLVVCGIVLAISAILLPSLAAVRSRALRTHCISNFHQLALADAMYGADNNDSIPPNKGGRDVPLGETWVQGWLHGGTADFTNSLLLKGSLLGDYLNEATVWRCPASDVYREYGGKSFPAARTVSRNHFMGAPWNVPPTTSYRRWADVVNPGPSDAWVLIEERAETINDATFSVRIDFDETQPSTWIINDLPAAHHRRATVFSFADGHAGPRIWLDPRTQMPVSDPKEMPNNPDVLWMQKHATFRMRP